MMTQKIEKLSSFNKFIPLALRTEAELPKVVTSRKYLLALLTANIAVTELLDGMKKQIFYGKSEKLVNKSFDQVKALKAALTVIEECVTEEDLVDEVEIDSRVLHGIIGIVTESGELSSALFNAITNGKLDPVNIQEEAVGDIGWYQAVLIDALGLDFYQGLTNVINKLVVRYPDKFSSENATHRNLDAERKELEVGNI